jgi:hypothetical protein
VSYLIVLSPSPLSKQCRLILRGFDFQEIPLITALIEADATLGVADEFIFRLLQLEGVHVESFVNGSGVEQELMGGNSEEGLGEFSHTRKHEVLQVL